MKTRNTTKPFLLSNIVSTVWFFSFLISYLLSLSLSLTLSLSLSLQTSLYLSVCLFLCIVSLSAPYVFRCLSSLFIFLCVTLSLAKFIQDTYLDSTPIFDQMFFFVLFFNKTPLFTQTCSQSYQPDVGKVYVLSLCLTLYMQDKQTITEGVLLH